MTPQDTKKDRGEVEADQCPDCKHNVEDCICEDDYSCPTCGEYDDCCVCPERD